MKPSFPSIQKQLNLAPAIRMIVPATILKEFSAELSESQFYFIHLLVSKAVDSGKPLHSFHSLRLDFLVKQLGSKPRERQIKGLIDMGVVAVQTNQEGKETYEPGKRAKAYQLTERYRLDIKNDKLTTYYSKAGSTLSKRLMTLRLNQKNTSLEANPLIAREYEWLKNLSFDEDRAREFQDDFEQSGVRGSKPYTRQASLRLESDITILSQLSSGDITFNYNGSRLTTSVCNAMKQMRECIMDDKGNYFVELDLRSSQLVFLCKAIIVAHENDITVNIKYHLDKFTQDDIDITTDSIGPHSDTAMFIKHVIYGDIYRELQINDNEYHEEWTDLDANTASKGFAVTSNKGYDISRLDYKPIVLKQLLFNYYTRKQNIPDIAKAFSQSYPSIESFLMSIAAESQSHRRSTDLANVTQSYEGYFFHKLALDRLQEAFPDRDFYTVHDCIGVPEDIAEEAGVLLNKALESHLGISAGIGMIRYD
ncbi:hypothetical protein N9E60_02075 [Schleiferiaceae bacterium]|nr:hypothetical protein [Schleiferiaceae bacterium]